MNLASEAGIATKVRRMADRVRWGHPEISSRGIDPCRLAIEGDPGAPEAFSFLVLGDSGTGLHLTVEGMPGSRTADDAQRWRRLAVAIRCVRERVAVDGGVGVIWHRMRRGDGCREDPPSRIG